MTLIQGSSAPLDNGSLTLTFGKPAQLSRDGAGLRSVAPVAINKRFTILVQF
jgi:hypothetical protein